MSAIADAPTRASTVGERAPQLAAARLLQRVGAKLGAGLVAVALGALLFWWFSAYNYHNLMGDDLLLLNESRRPGGFVNGLWDSLGQTGAGKYRPVLQLVLAATTDHFGGSFLSYKVLNTLILLMCCLLIARITYRASRGSWVVAIAAAAALGVSRFNLYYVLQGLGVMEGLALMFLLVTIAATQQLFDSKDVRWLIVVNVAFFLLVYTHERFLALAPAVAVASVLALSTSSRRVRIAWGLVPIATFLSNFAVKAWVLHIDFLTGAAGEKVSLTPRGVVAFMVRGTLNVFGYNSGPDYLSGRNAHALGATAVALAAIFGIPALLLLAWAGVGRPDLSVERSWRTVSSRAVVAVLFFVPLIGTASISFRQEFRWLYAPFALILIGLAYGLGNLSRHRALQVIGALLVLGASLSVDSYYRQFARNTYFFSGQDTADSAYNAVVRAHRDELESTTIFIISHGDAIFTGWFMGGDAFASVYAKGLDPDIRFVDDTSAIGGALDVRSRILVFDFQGNRVVETEFPTP